MMNKILQKLNDNNVLINRNLETYFEKHDEKYSVLFDSIKYSLLNGGKRIRPFLTMEFCRLFGGSDDAALPFACALEMIHTYSLIHDDLPCMDNDSIRRGKPTNHIVFGEATAMLAGDALLTRAFSVVCSNKYVLDKYIIKAVRLLADNSGVFGMVGGQQLDLIGEEIKYGFNDLKYMQYLKTGKLFIAACILGCYAALGYKEDEALENEYISAASEYAEKTGLAFQITDDILDTTGDIAVLGKTVGLDNINNKTTFLSFMNIDEAFLYASKLTDEARGAIAGYDNSEVLCGTALYLLNRKS